MAIRNWTFLALLLASFVYWGCGSSSSATKTGTQEKEQPSLESAAGSSTSTGLCKTFSTKKEEQEVYKNISLYKEFFKQGNYKDGLPYWEKVMEQAPGFRKTPFIDGEKMYKHYADEAASDMGKNLYVNKLLALYDERVKCHGEEGAVMEKKAFSLLKYDRKDEAYGLMEKSLDLNKDAANVLVLKSLYSRYLGDFKDKVKTEADVKAFGDRIRPWIDGAIASGKDTDGKYAELLEKINKPLTATKTVTTTTTKSPTADINTYEDAKAYYGPKMDADPSDVDNLKRYYSKLTKIKCYKTAGSECERTYIKLISDINRIAPSKATLTKGAIYEMKAKNYDAAIGFYQKAIEMLDNNDDKAKYYLYVSSAYRSKKDNQTAAEWAEKALQLKPGFGKAYVTLGNCYLGTYGKCGTSKVEKAGLAWLAADMFNKAKQDPESADKAQKGLNTAYKYFPEKADIFMMDISEGAPHRVGCWIQKTTTVRSK